MIELQNNYLFGSSKHKLTFICVARCCLRLLFCLIWHGQCGHLNCGGLLPHSYCWWRTRWEFLLYALPQSLQTKGLSESEYKPFDDCWLTLPPNVCADVKRIFSGTYVLAIQSCTSLSETQKNYKRICENLVSYQEKSIHASLQKIKNKKNSNY